jgi:hypothetical protein
MFRDGIFYASVPSVGSEYTSRWLRDFLGRNLPMANPHALVVVDNVHSKLALEGVRDVVFGMPGSELHRVRWMVVSSLSEEGDTNGKFAKGASTLFHSMARVQSVQDALKLSVSPLTVGEVLIRSYSASISATDLVPPHVGFLVVEGGRRLVDTAEEKRSAWTEACELHIGEGKSEAEASVLALRDIFVHYLELTDPPLASGVSALLSRPVGSGPSAFEHTATTMGLVLRTEPFGDPPLRAVKRLGEVIVERMNAVDAVSLSSIGKFEDIVQSDPEWFDIHNRLAIVTDNALLRTQSKEVGPALGSRQESTA